MSQPIRYNRITADAFGETHFSDGELDVDLAVLAPPADAMYLSSFFPAEKIVLCHLVPGWVGTWHPAPYRGWWFVLQGELEVEVTDGQKRRLPSGSITLTEDVQGKGHLTRVIGQQPVIMASVALQNP
jgi:hypothetical protein